MNAIDSHADAPVPDAALRALLLHRLGDAESEELERRLLVEDGLAERLRHVEYELLDAYARGRLGGQDGDDVRRHLLRTAAERQRLGVAQALAQMQAPSLAPRRPLGRFAPRTRLLAAAAVLVGIVAAVALLPRPPAGQPPAAVSRVDAEAPVYTVSLLAGVSRGESQQVLPVPAATASIRLQVEVEQGGDAGAVYELQVADDAGRVLQSATALGLQQAGTHVYVEALLPLSVLAPGPRRISLHAAGKPAQAPWRIELRPG